MANKQKNPHAKIFEVTGENDVKYRGPLHYQHFQILGWLCIVVSQVLLIFRLFGKLDPSLTESNSALQGILEAVAPMSLPLLLIANFAQILDDSDGYRKQLIKYGAASLLFYAGSMLLIHRYVIGSLAGICTHPDDALALAEIVFRSISSTGFISFNLFLDLLLCTLVMFFLNYRPRRFFQGRSLHVFRLFAILPVAYEVVCMVLKVLSSKGRILLPFWSFPLLTVKPPMTFVLFIVLAVFIKTRELRFRRHGKTHEQYKAFLKTNRNSLNFAIFLAVMLIVVSVVDFAVMIGYSAINTATRLEQAAAFETEETQQLFEEFPEEETEQIVQELHKTIGETAAEEVDTARALGFGGSVNLVFLFPLVLLFSYTREPRFSKTSIFIPIGAVLLILFVYLESFRLLMWNLPVPKVDAAEFIDSCRSFLETMQ